MADAIERVLEAAARDTTFREELLADCERAIHSRGIDLTQAELASLVATPRDQLRANIAAVETRLEPRSREAKTTQTFGPRPDAPAPPPPPPPAGIRPDRPKPGSK